MSKTPTELLTAVRAMTGAAAVRSAASAEKEPGQSRSERLCPGRSPP